VAAVGGDGSVNDVAKGLVGSKTALAIIPKGSGNGMARSLEIPLDVAQAIKVINGGNSIMMDLGYVNEYSFISNAGVGFDTVVSQQFASSKKRGLMVYAWLTVKNLLNYRELDWQLTVDGVTTTERAFIINVANGKQFGYNFQIAPDASWTDGLFDIIVICKFPKLLAITLAWRALRGTIHRSPYVRVVRGKEVTISHRDLQFFQTDGDAQPAKNPLSFHVEEGVLKVLVPR
jgi:YegS/Rv2252/BmrU family lipid kinase